jgi:hypothetical protein
VEREFDLCFIILSQLIPPNQRESRDANRRVQQQQRPVAARALLINDAGTRI